MQPVFIRERIMKRRPYTDNKCQVKKLHLDQRYTINTPFSRDMEIWNTLITLYLSTHWRLDWDPLARP